MNKEDWEKGFQHWSDNMFNDPTTSYGKCDYGAMCDYCEGSNLDTPCMRALRNWAEEKGKHIDYETAQFEDVWNGKV